MPRDQIDEPELLLTALPIHVYRVDKDAYKWPKKNRCSCCLVGKFQHIKRTSILKCKVCKAEFHIPHVA